MYTPVNPSFTILKWGLRGSKLYRRVFVMNILKLKNIQIKFGCFANVHCLDRAYAIHFRPETGFVVSAC